MCLKRKVQIPDQLSAFCGHGRCNNSSAIEYQGPRLQPQCRPLQCLLWPQCLAQMDALCGHPQRPRALRRRPAQKAVELVESKLPNPRRLQGENAKLDMREPMRRPECPCHCKKLFRNSNRKDYRRDLCTSIVRVIRHIAQSRTRLRAKQHYTRFL